MDDLPREQRQLRQAVSVAARDFQRMAGRRNSRQSVKQWLGELHSITESTAWGQYFGVSVKLPCGDVTVGVPESAVRRWSNTSVDPIASSCAPADPYISSNTSFVANLTRLSIGQRVTFACGYRKLNSERNSSRKCRTISIPKSFVLTRSQRLEDPDGMDRLRFRLRASLTQAHRFDNNPRRRSNSASDGTFSRNSLFQNARAFYAFGVANSRSPALRCVALGCNSGHLRNLS